MKINNVYSEWMTRKITSDYLSCSINWLDTRCPIKKYYLGRSVRYNKNDLDSYLFSNCKVPKFGGNNNE